MLPAVDLPRDDGDRLLIDAGRVPALDRGEVGLARLIARARDPAMPFEEIRGGGERVRLVVQIHHPVAVAVMLKKRLVILKSAGEVIVLVKLMINILVIKME